jgi:hypothetical protein
MELHPLCRQTSIVSDLKARGIVVQQYSPLGKGDPCLMQHPVLQRIANDIDLFRGSVGRLCLLWGIAHGYRTVVRCSPRHLAENAELFSEYGYLTPVAGSALGCDKEKLTTLQQTVAAVDEAVLATDPTDRHVCWFSEHVA